MVATMWMLSAGAALLSFAASLFLCHRLFARSARHPERRTGMLVVAALLTLAQTAMALFAAVADHGERQYQLAWLILLPAWCALGAIAGALALMALPKSARGSATGIWAGLLCVGAFGIGCCYAITLGG